MNLMRFRLAIIAWLCGGVSAATAMADTTSDLIAQLVAAADRDRDGALTVEELETLPPPLKDRLRATDVSFAKTQPVPDLLRALGATPPATATSVSPSPTPGATTPTTPATVATVTPATTPAAPTTTISPTATATQPPLATPTAAPSATPTLAAPSAAAAMAARGLATKKPRVTQDLPSSHSAADTDFDGQIGMYEWRQWKGRAGLAEFHRYDRDRDGFVTPRELALGPLATPTTAPPQATTSLPGSPSTPPAAASSSGGVSSAAEQEQAELARKYYGMLDKDRNGKISTEEWTISKRIRGAFEQGKVDMTNMNEADFVTQYVRLLGNVPR